MDQRIAAIRPAWAPHASITSFLTANAPPSANTRLSEKTEPLTAPKREKKSASRREYPGSITAVGVSTGARPNM